MQEKKKKKIYLSPSIKPKGKFRNKTKSVWGKRNETYFSSHYGGWFE